MGVFNVQVLNTPKHGQVLNTPKHDQGLNTPKKRPRVEHSNTRHFICMITDKTGV
jgi:hypothetical protein